MTLEEIRALDREMLIPAEVAEVIGCDPYAINVQAKADASKLGFPVCVMGSRVRIPRLAFLRWLQCGNAPTLDEEQSEHEFRRLCALHTRQLEALTGRAGEAAREA